MSFFLPYLSNRILYVFGYPAIYLFDWFLISWVGKIIALFLIVFPETKRLKLNKVTSIYIFLLTIFLTEYFARIIFVLSHYFLHHDLSKFHNNYGTLGRVYFGAFIGSLLAIWLGTLIGKERKNIGKYFDIFLIYQIVTLFAYRIGNFMSHSHVGKITHLPWGIYYQGQLRHEPSMYELISLAILFCIVWPLRKKINPPGLLSIIIIGWISASRFIIDFFRGIDVPNSNFRLGNGLTLNQAMLALLFLACLALAVSIIKKHGANVSSKSNSNNQPEN